MKVIARGTTWQVHFDGPDGERLRLSTKVKVNPNLPDKGKAMASLAALDVMREALSGALPAEARKEAGRGKNLAYALRRTFDERWAHQRSSREKRYVVDRLAIEVGYWPLASVTYSKLHDFGMERAAAGDAPATLNRKMSAIHTAMSDAQRRGEIESLPQFPHWAENNVKERYLTLEEEKALLRSMEAHAAPADEEGQYLLQMVPFLLDTGLRAGEAMVKPNQDLGDKIWLPHGTTKSGRGRSVPLTSRARAALTAILASPVHTRLLAMAAGRKDLPSAWMGRHFRTACARARIQGVTLHTLRHTCASRLVQAGVSLYVVKEWLGHSSITVTERYAHLAPKNLEAAAAALEQLRPVAPQLPLGTPPEPRGTVH